jgi:hypothetical protein
LRIAAALHAVPPPPRLAYDAVVVTAPRASGGETLCATLASLELHAAPHALAVSYGRSSAADLAKLLAACPAAASRAALFALPPDTPRASVLEAYYAALRAGVSLASERRNASGVTPLLVLEDDVLLSPLFTPALDAAAAALRAAGVRRYMLSLYNGVLPPLNGTAARARELAARRRHYCSPWARAARAAGCAAPQPLSDDGVVGSLGAGLLRGAWGWGTQALLFSHPADAGAYFWRRTQLAPAHDGGSAFVGLQDMLLREYVYERDAGAALRDALPADAQETAQEEEPPAVYGMDVSLVQHVGTSSTLFGNASAGNTRFHAAPDFLACEPGAGGLCGGGGGGGGERGEAGGSGTAAAELEVEAPRWPAVWREYPGGCAPALVTPCCDGPSGFAPPGAPLRASSLRAALAAAEHAAPPHTVAAEALTFRLTGAPCARAGCCTVFLALRARARGGEADVAELEALLLLSGAGGEHAHSLLPRLLNALRAAPASPSSPAAPPSPPASVLHAGARAGAAAVLMAHAWPGARIVALEPDGDAFHALQRSAAGLANITALRARLRATGGDNSSADAAVSIDELARAHLNGNGAPPGFSLVWLDVRGGVAALRALLTAPDAAAWLGAAHALVLALRGGGEDASRVSRRRLRAALLPALPRREWAHVALAAAPPPAARITLHVFTRRRR